MEKTPFAVEVEAVGTFQCRRRTMRDEMRIEAEYSRLTEGVDTPSRYLDMVATMLATLKVLVDEAPAGWDINAMDPLDPTTYERLIAVFSQLREREEFFRSSPGKAGQGDRQTGGGVDPAVVPKDVPTGAD